jgi:hypothetical protein
MKKHILLILTVLFFAFAAAAQEKEAKPADSAPKTETLLRVETDNAKPFELKAADLAKLPRREVKGKTHDGAEAMFAGVELREVLKLAGVKFGKEAKGAHLNSFLVVEAADDYRVVFAMSELEADLTDKVILLADTRDGKPLSKAEGNVRLVVPDEKKQARWVRQVVVLKIKKI